MAVQLLGAPVAAALIKKMEQQMTQLEKLHVHPCLEIIRIGNRPDSLAYERGATRRAEQLGVYTKQIGLPENVTEEDLLEEIQTVNRDDAIHGCLLLCPLPERLNREKIANVLMPQKDIDAITTASMGGLLTQTGVHFAPCTASACMEILHYYNINLKGKKVALIGKSSTVGLPTALLLMNEEATVSVCHILTDPKDTQCFCQGADIIVSAAGCVGLINANYVRKGQVIIDVGINVNAAGKLCGDVDFAQVEPIVDAITPVPGGVGAVTSTIMVGHVVEAALHAHLPL